MESHPVLLVTSPLKMRTAKTLSLSYSGSMSQTISFLKDQQSLNANLEAARALVSSMGEPDLCGPIRKRGSYEDAWKRSFLWADVSADHVLDFFKSYKTPPGADRANTMVMAEFVEQMNSVGELQKWTVALLAEGRKAPACYEFSPVVSVDSFPTQWLKRRTSSSIASVLSNFVSGSVSAAVSSFVAISSGVRCV